MLGVQASRERHATEERYIDCHTEHLEHAAPFEGCLSDPVTTLFFTVHGTDAGLNSMHTCALVPHNEPQRISK